MRAFSASVAGCELDDHAETFGELAGYLRLSNAATNIHALADLARGEKWDGVGPPPAWLDD